MQTPNIDTFFYEHAGSPALIESAANWVEYGTVDYISGPNYPKVALFHRAACRVANVLPRPIPDDHLDRRAHCPVLTTTLELK